MIFLCIDALVDDPLVGLVLVDVLKFLLQEPCRRVEPLEEHAHIGQKQVPRMAVADVRPLVRQYGLSPFGQILFRQNNAFHPTERSNGLVVGEEQHPIVEAFLLATVYQANHPRQRPEIADEEKHYTYYIYEK